MKQLISYIALGLALAVGVAHAADEKAPTAQQGKMKTCNADAKAKTLKGDERKAFMSTCLRGRHEAGAASAAAGAAPAAVPAAAVVDGASEAVKAPVAAAVTAEAAPAATAPATVAPATVAAAETAGADDKARAKACNQSATEQSLRGAKRKAFIAECLKG